MLIVIILLLSFLPRTSRWLIKDWGFGAPAGQSPEILLVPMWIINLAKSSTSTNWIFCMPLFGKGIGILNLIRLKNINKSVA